MIILTYFYFKIKERVSLWALLMAAIALLYLPWSYILYQSNDLLRVYFLDVGQGDAALIILPDGQKLLIDVGPPDAVLYELSNILPPHERYIDAVFISHPQEDHIGALETLLSQYSVSQLFVTKPNWYSYELPGNLKISPKPLYQGEIISISEGVTMRVLWPPRYLESFENLDINYFSQMLLFSYHDFDVLFTGDAEVGSDSPVDYGFDWPVAEVLKVPHHGSARGITELFLTQTKPQLAVVSVGKNWFGHPNQEVLELLLGFGIKLWRTDQDGRLEILSDGKGWRVKQ